MEQPAPAYGVQHAAVPLGCADVTPRGFSHCLEIYRYPSTFYKCLGLWFIYSIADIDARYKIY